MTCEETRSTSSSTIDEQNDRGRPSDDRNEGHWLRLTLEAAEMCANRQDMKTGRVVRSFEPCQESFYDSSRGSWTSPERMREVHPEDRIWVESEINDAVRDKKPFRIELRMINAEKQTHWVQFNGRALYDAYGAAYEILSVGHDITQRKDAESRDHEKNRELAIAKKKLAMALDLAGMVALSGYTVGNSYKSPELCHLLGLPPGSALDQSRLLSIVHPGDREEMIMKIGSLDNSNGTANYEFRIVMPDASIKWIQSKGAYLSEKPGHRERSGVMQDVTASKIQEEEMRSKSRELAAMNRKLSLFSSVVAHDLKGSLSSISMASELLTEASTDEEIKEASTFIRRGAARMSTLIDDLLNFAKAENLNSSMMQPISLEEVFEQVRENLKASIRQQNACLNSSAPLPTVLGFRSALLQLLQNLVANAPKFRAERQPQIEIRIDEQTDQWIISVADNGVGFDPAVAAGIFEPFQRFHAQRYEGTGLGLSICKKIVEQHGGKLTYTSQVDVGTTFSFSIPKIKTT